MPQLLDCRRLILEFADLAKRSPLIRPPKPPDRAPGAHQSDILAYVARKIGKLKPGEQLEEDMPERVAMGFMFEEFYFSLIPDVCWQPGEITKDGISTNCDGLGVWTQDATPYGQLLDEWEPYLEETKFTEKKVRTGEELLEEWMWMHQGRAYCEAYQVRVVKWTIWYYRGDWRGSGPQCWQYLVRFTDQEVRQTWDMLKVNKEPAMTALAAA